MTERPHDLTDLYLSPVALQLDHRLRELEGLSETELEVRVAVATDRDPRLGQDRSHLALEMLTHALEMHGWEASWASRGLRLRHADHELVLGLPDSLRAFIARA